MKTVIELTNKECRDCYPELKQNAEQLFASSKLLAEHHQYGHAIGLLILGAEEYIKSFFLFLEGYGFNLLKFKEVQAVFLHRGAHYMILRDSYSIWLLLGQVLDHNPALSTETTDLKLLRTKLSLLRSRNQSHWWEKADHLKQKGLYADYLQRLVSPSNLTASDYKNAVSKTAAIPTETARYIKLIKELNNRDLTSCLHFFDIIGLRQMIEELITEDNVKKQPTLKSE
ncbi:MAG TPA: AbiV family abortive infection protein [Lacibacter sp.]|jgi:AbiV family abortive infection protein|nr:AbiV family abortive infection protein [Lacibacter sp.]